jgi:predicted glutamine amidotransferase
MCRMIVAAGNIDIKKVFASAIAMAKDTNSVHEFNEANGPGSWVHDDGWGIAWLKKGKWHQFKSTTAIFNDPQIASFHSLDAEFVMLHVRKRMGSGTAIENTHPFHINRQDVGSFMFCHNGYAGEEFSFCDSFKLKGKTDSERLFYSILTEMKNHDLRCAVPNVLNKIETKTGTNIVLSNVDKSFIALKENNYPKYYTMTIARSDDCVMVLSETVDNVLGGFSLETLNANQMISLDHRTLDVTKIEYRQCVVNEQVLVSN